MHGEASASNNTTQIHRSLMIIKASEIVSYEIPDDWIVFVELAKWNRRTEFFPHTGFADRIPLTDVEPLQRSLPPHGFAVRKYKLVPVLFGFQNPELMFDPIEVCVNQTKSAYRYQLHNGIHRYIASLIVGYTKIPVLIKEK